MKNFNYYGYFTFFGILFLIVMYKVFNVPITHDEVPTTIFYSRFSYWEIMMFPDNIPNNHILNTLLTKLCIQLFGKEQWAVRLPNLLSFILFGIGAFRIIKQNIKSNSVYFMAAAVLFVNPYLLDFFGLSRGYGLSSALLTLSLSFLISGYKFDKNRDVWFSLIIAILASYANFTLLVFWVASTILVLFYFLNQSQWKFQQLLKPVLLIGLVSLAYLALIFIPIQKMQSTNEFQYWSSNGFYKETALSLIHNWRYESSILERINSSVISVFIGSILLTNLGYLYLLKKSRSKIFSSPVFIATVSLILTCIISISQSLILKTPNLNGRTAMFIYPLFSASLVAAIGLIPEKNIFFNRILPISLLLICMLNLTNRVTLKSVKEWSYDQSNLEVINYLKDISGDKPVSLKTSWFFNPSLTFYSETGKIPWIELHPYDKNIDINTSADYYYVFSEEFKLLEPKFEVVYKFSDDRWLVKVK